MLEDFRAGALLGLRHGHIIHLKRIRRKLSMIPGVVEQRHESEVHVQLLVTVEQRQARIVRGKVDIEFLISAQHNDIFHDPRCDQPCQLRYLKTVSMKVNGMDIVTRIPHVKAIAPALEQVTRRRHRASWKNSLIDRP